MYTYVGNNPVNFTDPTGHDAVPKTQATIDSAQYNVLAQEKDNQGNTVVVLTTDGTSQGDVVIIPAPPDRKTGLNPDFFTGAFTAGTTSVGITHTDTGATYYCGTWNGVDAQPSGSADFGWILGDNRDSESFSDGTGQTTTVTLFFVNVGIATSSDGRHAFVLGYNSALVDATYSEGLCKRITED